MSDLLANPAFSAFKSEPDFDHFPPFARLPPRSQWPSPIAPTLTTAPRGSSCPLLAPFQSVLSPEAPMILLTCASPWHSAQSLPRPLGCAPVLSALMAFLFCFCLIGDFVFPWTQEAASHLRMCALTMSPVCDSPPGVQLAYPPHTHLLPEVFA